MMINSRKSRILPAIIISLIIPFMVFLAKPMEMYCMNREELNFAFLDVLPSCCLFFIGSFVIIFVILLFLPKRLFSIAYGLLVGTAIMCLIQYNVLNQNVDCSLPLDNFWGIPAETVRSNTIVWILIICLAILLFVFIKNSIVRTVGVVVSIFLLTTQITSFTDSVIKTPDVFLKWKEQHPDKEYIITTEGLKTFSASHNIFIFCLDRLDQSLLEDIYLRNPELFYGLSDFIWCDDCTSVYGHTFPSVTYMLTGITHNIDECRDDYFTRSFHTSEILNTLKERDYEIRFYSEPYYSYSSGKSLVDVIENFSEVTDKTVDSKIKLAYHLAKASIYKISPLFLRTSSYFKNLSTEQITSHIQIVSDGKKYDSDIGMVKDGFAEADLIYSDKNVLSFIHTKGMHVLSDRELLSDDYSDTKHVEEVLSDNLELVYQYINTLKALGGIYENATIIVTGDHGNGQGNNGPLSDSNLTAFFFKSSSHLNLNSLKGISHENMWRLISKSEGLTDFNEEIESRQFFWDTTDGKRYVYNISDNARDFANWKLEEIQETEIDNITWDKKNM